MVPFALITLIFKNIGPAVIFGVVVSISNSVIISSEYAPLSFWCSPILYARDELVNYNYGVKLPLLLIIFTFIISLIISMIYFKLNDVDL